jgi:hypothetical protein
MKRLAVFLFLCITLFSVLACDLPGTTVTTTTTTIAIEDIDDWVEVDTLAELIAVEKTNHVRLVGDIDLANAEWTPLGNQNEPFSGIFDGNGHTISNVRITSKHDDFVGFFGVLTGTVFDLTLADMTIDYTTDFLSYAGLLAGYVSGDLSNIAVSGSIRILSSQSNVFAGGLAGFATSKVAQSTTATQFQATVFETIAVDVSIQIDAKNYVFVGGLAGKTYNVAILGATIDTQIEATNDQYRIYAGGLSGHNYSGLLKGFEHVLDNTDIVHEDLLVKATIQTIGLKGAVGGLYGHDSYGVVRRAAASLTVHFGGEPLTSGGLAGESWNGSYHQSAASLVFGTAVVDHDAYEWGPLVGSTWGTILASSSVYALNTTLTPTTSFGIETPLTSLQSPDFFEIELSWGESERLQAAADLFQP